MKLKKNAEVVLTFGFEHTVTKIVSIMDTEEGKLYECDARPGIFLPEDNFLEMATYIQIMESVNKTNKERLVSLVNKNSKLKEICENLKTENASLIKKTKDLEKKMCSKGQADAKNKELLLHTLAHLRNDIEKI